MMIIPTKRIKALGFTFLASTAPTEDASTPPIIKASITGQLSRPTKNKKSHH